MPRNVRPFYIKGEVDGIKTPISTGPRSKDGCIRLEINIREHGCVSGKVMVIEGYHLGEDLVLQASIHSDGPVVLTGKKGHGVCRLRVKRDK